MVRREAFDFVVRTAGPGGHLVGSRFTVADLAPQAELHRTSVPRSFFSTLTALAHVGITPA